MFDISFSELMIVGVVALIVIGPERLPRVARTAGHFLGRFQRYVAQVKADINREMELAELRDLQTSVKDAARDLEQSIKSQMDSAEQELRSAESELRKAGEEVREAAQISAPPVHMGALQHEQAGTEPGASRATESAQASTSPPATVPADPETSLQSEPLEPPPQLELGLEPEAPSKHA